MAWPLLLGADLLGRTELFFTILLYMLLPIRYNK